jgi:lipopolysaccharide heptosyltransferase II
LGWQMIISRLLKFVDATVGKAAANIIVFVARGKDDACSKSSRRAESILFIRPGGIGDAVLLIPSIILLKKAFPQANLDILAEKRNSGVFAFCPDVSTVYHYERPTEFLKALRQTYDVVIDSEQWHRLSAVVARMTRAPMSIGFATNERKKLFTHPVSYSHDDYEMDSFMNLVEPLIHNVTRERSMPFLTISPEMTSTVRPLLEPLLKSKIVALFPGSSIEERRWGNDRFHQAAKLLSDRGYGIVVVGGKEDIKAGQEIADGIPTALNLCGKLSLPETAAVLKESALLIAGDSGIMHVGYGLGIKIVALFGPGRELKWAPRSSQVAVINKNLSCSPCTKFGYTPKCPINAACMKSIAVEEVVEKVRALMQE